MSPVANTNGAFTSMQGFAQVFSVSLQTDAERMMWHDIIKIGLLVRLLIHKLDGVHQEVPLVKIFRISTDFKDGHCEVVRTGTTFTN